MQFLDQRKVQILFSDCRSRASNPDKRITRLTFALDLDDELVGFLPVGVRKAYRAMTAPNSVKRAELDFTLKGRTVELQIAPDTKVAALKAVAVEFVQLRLEKVESKARTGSMITLFFTFSLPFEEAFTFGANLGHPVWMTNSPTQLSLPQEARP